MRLLHIRAGTEAEAICLMLGLLAAIETCLVANDIRSVRVELDGRPYLLAPQSTS